MTARPLRAPGWFAVVAILLLLWGAAGCVSFYLHLTFDPDTASPYDRALFRSLPGWLDAVYAVSVGGGVVGAVLLLVRSRRAVVAFVASLVAIVVQFGWVFLATDLIAAKGVATATGFPAVILAIGVFQLWLARHAVRHGWIA